IARGSNPVTPGEAEDEVADAVTNATRLSVGTFLCHEDPVVELGGPPDWNNPRPSVWIITTIELVQLLGGDEAAVRHQAFVNGTKLVDPKGGVADRLARLSRLLAGEAEVSQNLLHRLVRDPGPFEHWTRRVRKQSGTESRERQSGSIDVERDLGFIA